MPAREPITIAIVRDIHQRGWFSTLVDPFIRSDGWVQDSIKHEWYSPDNVISVTSFIPRKWDGNDLKPGDLCELPVWRGVTTARVTGYDSDFVTVISYDKGGSTCVVLMSDGTRRKVGSRKLAPIMSSKCDSDVTHAPADAPAGV